MDMLGSLIMVALLVFVALAAARIYNKLITLKNRYKNAFSQIDVQLTRRYDLIPNLVETAKAYMTHERETLTAVIAARNQAVANLRLAAENPGNLAAMGALTASDRGLEAMLSRFMALTENYPDLKASDNMRQLSEELTSAENRVAFARQAYNDAVTAYNIGREHFPANIVASFFHFPMAVLLDIEEEGKRQAPKVSFA
ncbi:MAG: LemA family protein [Desulfobulbaceae bacterium]|nr:LemA family protein [Desulfobulbaceae bacterium]